MKTKYEPGQIVSDSDSDEEEYMKEIEIINEMFPDIRFVIAIRLAEMDEIISEKDTIVIKSDYRCYCYRYAHRNTDFFIINRPKNGKITYKHIFTELMNQELDLLDCDHRFIEGIVQTPNSECQFEFWLGS